ncbi:IS3 family transposase [Escherichia coli]|uniref:IS3 family transposase n=1 Tax=Escherichia coli TaxID=562 RepID=UPI001BDBA5F6|nr:IS3 family transposase [Escherichia coli]
MKKRNFSAEFKRESAQLVVDQKYTVADAAKAMDVGLSTMTRWVKQLRDERQGKTPKASPITPEQIEIRKLFYAWLQQPHSQRHQADLRLTGQIKQFWLESGCVYGYRKIHLDLRDSGQQCGVNRVWRLMKRVGIKAQVGYRSPRARKGEASIMSPNRLQRQFNPDAPDERWVTDITYIRTHEGWLYLAVVVDLFSRKIIGWSMQSRMTKDIVLNALLMAVWRRNPEKQVLVHSDQGSQYTSHEWQSFLKSHGLEGSMSRRGNCHDNAVAESFFQLLKRERIKKKIYGTREEARSDIFDYIEMFYNSKRRHGSSEQMSPTEYENQYYQRLGSV